MNFSFTVSGIKPSPIGLYINAYNLDLCESGQSSNRVTSSSEFLHKNIYRYSNDYISQIESNTGFPKGSNSCGNGTLIVRNKWNVQFISKVG